MKNKPKHQSFFQNHKIGCTISLMVLAFIFLIIFFTQTHNADSQINKLEEDIQKHNYKSIAETLSTNERTMTKIEAKHLAEYFDNKKHQEQLKKDIKNIKSKANSNQNSASLGAIYNEKNEPIISFSYDGKQYLFLNKIAIQAHYRNVYVREINQPATYKFQNYKLMTKGNGLSFLGSFIEGDYSEPVEKRFKNKPVRGSVHGKIHINTSKRDESNKIIAEQSFNQTKLKVKLKNKDLFKEKDIQIYINNNPVEGSIDKTFGYFPNNNPIKVEAKGKLKNHTFTTDAVHVMQNIDNKTKFVILEFDKKQIDDILKKESSEKMKISKFIENYIKHLNEAYDKQSYQPIKDDIKSNSVAEDFMKPKFDEKREISYKSVKVISVEKSNNNFDILISKKYKNNIITTLYKVTKVDDKFKITSIADQ